MFTARGRGCFMRHASTSPPASSSSAKRLCSFFVKPGVPRSSTLRPLNPRANPSVNLLGSPPFRCATRVCCAMSLHSIDEAKRRRRDACIAAPHGSVSPDLGIVLATRLTKADIGNVQIVQRHVEVTYPHELVVRSGMKRLRSTGISIGCARSMICYWEPGECLWDYWLHWKHWDSQFTSLDFPSGRCSAQRAS
jgi:hypothetical protein